MNELKNIFLSASVPDSACDPIYRENLDVIAIRDAVLALATLIPPNFRLIWGGHPAITPIIANVINNLNYNANNFVTLYQSDYYAEKNRPKENRYIAKIINTTKKETQEESLKVMRYEMICKNSFVAAVYIGGKKGVLDEYEIFSKEHPDVKNFPVPTTGGAAKILYNRNPQKFGDFLKGEYAYLALFKKILDSIGK